MKAIAKLKDDARKFEQKEEWEKAIQAYLEVLQAGEQGDGADLDLPLYNRVGDLYVRLGRASDAVTYYAKAADRYAEAGLYNNAIALCNKALRYDSARLDLYKKLGSFSASQGFFTDARRWYLEYAEKMTRRGQLDDAFGALAEYADTNEDAEVRELLARQMKEHGRAEQAVDQFKRAYALRVAAGEQSEADALRAEIQAMDPSADFSAQAAPAPHAHATPDYKQQLPGFVDEQAPAAGTAVAEPEEQGLEIEPTAIGQGVDASAVEDYGSLNIESGFGGGASIDEVAPLDIGLEAPLGVKAEDLEGTGLELPAFEEEAVAEEEEAFELPTLDDFGDTATELPMLGEEEEAGEIEPLPGFDGEEVAAELPPIETEMTSPETAADLGSLDLGEVERDEMSLAGEALPTLDVDDLAGAETVEELPEIGEPPVFEEPEPMAKMPEPEPAPEPEPEPQPEPEPAPVPIAAAPPPPMPEPAAPAPPPKPKADYIDLAAFLTEDDEEVQDTTRFVVAEKAPTGDEEKDFADMLEQFKAKVAETIPKEDAGSHYDLGIAFKEMGLIDEAIGEFQTALRAGQEKLKVYEELGSCFVLKGQYSIAITVLNRAQQMPYSDEQELLGVYYNLGRAYEELGQRADAKAAYEKIVAIDIGFQDTTTRLARL